MRMRSMAVLAALVLAPLVTAQQATRSVPAAPIPPAPGARDAIQDAESRASSRPLTPKEQVEAIDREIEVAREDFFKLYKAATTPEEKQKLFEEKYPKPEAWFPRLFEIAKADPKGPGAEAALVWIVQNDGRGKHLGEALDVLLKDHVGSEALGAVAGALGYSYAPKAADFLKALEERSPHREVKGQALYAQAQRLQYHAGTAAYLRDLKEPKAIEQVEADLGAEELARLRAFDPAAAEKEIEVLLERVKKDYSDVEAGWGGTLGDRATGDLFEIRNLAIGKVAPEIEGEDIDGKPMKLGEFRGKVVVLDFWGNW